MNPTAQQIQQDLQLVRAITGGSVEAWQGFVIRYAGLIHSVLRRYLFDEEDVRTAYVDVLERLYGGKLASFEGRALLSTWLVMVARSTAMDFLRKRFGRRQMPSGLKRLSQLDRNVFRLYYVEGMSFDAVRHWAKRGDDALDANELAGILRRIESSVDDRVLQRIAYDLGATSVGAVSGRMLEFLDAYRAEAVSARTAQSPEYVLMEKEARQMARRVREALAELPEPERRVLELRFDDGWTARRIAEEMGLGGEQRVYTQIRRGLRRLRRALEKRHKRFKDGLP